MCTHSPFSPQNQHWLPLWLTGPFLTLSFLSCLALLSAPMLRGHTLSLPRTPVAFYLSSTTRSAAASPSCDPHVSCSCSLSLRSPAAALSYKGEPPETPPPLSLWPSSQCLQLSLALSPLLFVIVGIFKFALEKQKGKMNGRKKIFTFQHYLMSDSLGRWGFLLHDWPSGGTCVVNSCAVT